MQKGKWTSFWVCMDSQVHNQVGEELDFKIWVLSYIMCILSSIFVRIIN